MEKMKAGENPKKNKKSKQARERNGHIQHARVSDNFVRVAGRNENSDTGGSLPCESV